MENKKEKRIQIELPLEAVDTDEESYEERCEQRYEQSHEGSCDSKVCLIYDILRIVFRYLNGRDLSSAAMVCRLWLEAANNEKCLRGPYCFIEQLYCRDTIFTKSAERLNFDGIKQSPIKPSIGFCFLRRNEDLLYNDIKGSIYELLPKNCKIIMLLTHIIYLNNVIPPSQNMVCALLPQIPNVKISMVVVTDLIMKIDEYREYVQMIAGVSRRDHKTSTCLMLFCNRVGRKMRLYMATIAKIKLGNDVTISLCDGVMEDLHLQANNETVSSCEPYCVALLITGSIQTWSIVLEECLTGELIEEKLKLFKEKVKLQKHSVGFMFASETINLFNISIKHVLTIFKILFPKVPLVGCCGFSAFRRDYIIYKTDKLECPQCGKRWHNTCSTTFMILTYG